MYSLFYIAVNEALEVKHVAEAYGKLLFRVGKIASPTPNQVSYEDAGKVAG